MKSLTDKPFAPNIFMAPPLLEMNGQVVPLLKEIRTAEEIITSTVSECEKILGYEIC